MVPVYPAIAPCEPYKPEQTVIPILSLHFHLWAKKLIFFFLTINQSECRNKKERLPRAQTLMASLSMASVILRFSPLRSSPKVSSTHGSVQFARFSSSSLASAHCISGLRAVIPQKINTVVSQNPQRLQSLTVFAHKGYKMKTHKVSSFLCFSDH